MSLVVSPRYVVTIIVECCKNCSIVVSIARYKLFLHAIRRLTRTFVPRTSPVNDRTYTVGSKPGMCLDKRPDSPPAGRKGPCFFVKHLHNMQMFYEKANKRTMLPQANRGSIGSNVRFEHPPRTTRECFVMHSDLTEHHKPCNLLVLEKDIPVSSTFHLQVLARRLHVF